MVGPESDPAPESESDLAPEPVSESESARCGRLSPDTGYADSGADGEPVDDPAAADQARVRGPYQSWESASSEAEVVGSSSRGVAGIRVVSAPLGPCPPNPPAPCSPYPYPLGVLGVLGAGLSGALGRTPSGAFWGAPCGGVGEEFGGHPGADQPGGGGVP